MWTGLGTEVVARRACGTQLSSFSLIQIALFSVTVFAAVQHGGPEDFEERIVPLPL